MQESVKTKKKISEFMSKIYNRFLYVYILQMYLWPKSLEMVFSNSLPCQKEILIHQEFIKTRIFYKRFIKTCVRRGQVYTHAENIGLASKILHYSP